MSNAATIQAPANDPTPPARLYPAHDKLPVIEPTDAEFVQAILDYLPGDFNDDDTASITHEARKLVRLGASIECAVEDAFLAGRWL